MRRINHLPMQSRPWKRIADSRFGGGAQLKGDGGLLPSSPSADGEEDRMVAVLFFSSFEGGGSLHVGCNGIRITRNNDVIAAALRVRFGKLLQSHGPRARVHVILRGTRMCSRASYCRRMNEVRFATGGRCAEQAHACDLFPCRNLLVRLYRAWRQRRRTCAALKPTFVPASDLCPVLATIKYSSFKCISSRNTGNIPSLRHKILIGRSVNVKKYDRIFEFPSMQNYQNRVQLFEAS